MPDSPLRWGLIGAGSIAATVGADIAASPGSVLQAVAARDPERARRFAVEHGVAAAHEDYASLVADPQVDVVYVATTNAQHYEHALLALAAGKPVLVEKSFTLTADQARSVVGAARAAGLFCMEAMWLRTNPVIRQAQQWVHGGRIGELVGVRADLCHRFAFDPGSRLFDPAVGGGASLDLGSYVTHFAWAFLGAPERVEATGALAPTGVDATLSLQCSHAGGRFAQLHCSAVTDSPYAALLTGTEGWIRFDGRIHHPSAVTVHTADGEEVIEVPPQPGHGYQHEIAEVERCLGAGLLESPLVPLDDSVGVMTVLDVARHAVGAWFPGERS